MSTENDWRNPMIDDRKAVLEVLNQGRQMPLDVVSAQIMMVLADRGFRRTSVPEPSADWYDTHCPTCDAPEPWHTATCAVVHTKVPEPGEPSDAQVQRFIRNLWPLTSDRISMDRHDPWTSGRIRDALRAASAVTDQGEHR